MLKLKKLIAGVTITAAITTPVTALFLALALSAPTSAAPVLVYCENTFGNISVHRGRCPIGSRFIGVKN